MIRPQYVAALGRELGVDKQDVDNALEMNFSGSRAGLYREGSDLLRSWCARLRANGWTPIT